MTRATFADRGPLAGDVGSFGPVGQGQADGLRIGNANIRRALRVLELLAGDARGHGLAEVAAAIEVNEAAADRILADLAGLDYVVKDRRSGQYRAGFRLGSLGLRLLETAGTIRWAQDELDHLAAETRELVRLAIASGESLRWMAKAQGSASALTLDGISGTEVVLHATASGKAWLSTLPPEQVAEILSAIGLEAQTGRTATDLAAVLGEVAVARERGFALVEEEMEVGVSAIAVPIVPPEAMDGRAVATVSLAGPAARLSAVRLRAHAPRLTTVAASLGSQWHAYAYMDALSRKAPSAPPRRR